VSRYLVRCAVTLLAITVSAGCFSYIPTDFASVPAGEHVRIYVTRNVVNEVAEVTPISEPVLTGMVVSLHEDGLFLRMTTSMREQGFHRIAMGQDFMIPTREIIQLERRQFDHIGTGAFVAGTMGAAAMVLFVIMKAFGENEEELPCETNCELFAPRLSVPLRIR